jgi:hypothetical protein
MLKVQLSTLSWRNSIVLACALSACAEIAAAPEREPAPQFDPVTGHPLRTDEPAQTDSITYTLIRVPGGLEAWARATYVNRTGRSIYYARCNGNQTGPIFYVGRVPPDTTREMVGGFWGLFRILFELCISYSDDSDYCRPLPVADRRSNVFRILPP